MVRYGQNRGTSESVIHRREQTLTIADAIGRGGRRNTGSGIAGSLSDTTLGVIQIRGKDLVSQDLDRLRRSDAKPNLQTMRAEILDSDPAPIGQDLRERFILAAGND